MPDYLVLVDWESASITALEFKILSSFVRMVIVLKPFLNGTALISKPDADSKGSSRISDYASHIHFAEMKIE